MYKQCCPLQSSRQQFVTATIAGSLVMMTLGTNYCLGGLAPYIVSRLLASNRSSAEDGDSLEHPALAPVGTGSIVWVFVAAALFQGIGMLISGFAVAGAALDRRWSILGGCLISSIGTCLTGVTVSQSLALVILTSGVIFGLGQGMAYALILDSVTSWTDDRKGLLTGILVSSFAAGAIVFLPIQSKIVNPDNLTPDWHVGTDRLFSQAEVSARTPHSFFVMAAIYAVVQVACVGFIQRCRRMNDDVITSGDSSASGSSLGEDATLLATSSTADATASCEEHKELEAGQNAATQWTLKDAAASLPFIVMGVSIFFLTPASIVLPSLDKAYGETFISNDMLLSVLAGIGSVFNSVGRLVGGAVIDRVHFRVCVLTQGLLLAVLHALVPVSTATHPALYFILVCLVNFVFAGIFVFFPYAVESLYGSALFPQVYGLIFVFKAVSGAIIAIVTTAGLGFFGWTGIMWVTSVTSAIGGLAILLYNSDRWRLAVSLQ